MYASLAIRLLSNMRLGLASLVLFFLSASALAAESAIQWLERMSQAVHSLNYTGTFVYMQQGELESMRLVHTVDERGERERLVSLSGPDREVIREDGQVTCYLPDKGALVADHPEVPPGFPLNLPTHWEQLHNVYEFKLQSEARVAGQLARHVAIVPRDKFRYGQNYWIATDTGLLLRSNVVDERGEVAEQLEFTSVEVKEKIDESLLRPESGSRVVKLSPQRMDKTKTSPQPLHWQVSNLPAGFAMELQRQHAMGSEGVVVEHLIYSDGLTSVSVFIEPRDDEGMDEGSSRRGSVNAYTRHLPQRSITVLGEVPLATVRQIAESIAPLTQ